MWSTVGAKKQKTRIEGRGKGTECVGKKDSFCKDQKNGKEKGTKGGKV